MPGYQEMFLANLKFKMNNFSGSGFSVIHLHGVEGAHDFLGILQIRIQGGTWASPGTHGR